MQQLHTPTGMMAKSNTSRTRFFTTFKTPTTQGDEVKCRVHGKSLVVLSDCSVLAQDRYLLIHNDVFQELLFETCDWQTQYLRVSLCLSPQTGQGHTRMKRCFTEHEYLLQNRVNAAVIDYKERKVIAVDRAVHGWAIGCRKRKGRQGIMTGRDENLNSIIPDPA